MIKFISTSEVIFARSRSRSSHYLDVQKGLWTPPIKIGERSSGYPDDEVAILMEAYRRGKSLDQIRTLVVDLISTRQMGEA
jgi:prophage regulatory protein